MYKLRNLYPELLRGVNGPSRAFYELVLPPVDIYEISGSLVVEADLPGFNKEQINVRATGRTLTITAKREQEEDVDSFYVSQRPRRIRKSIPLPVEVDDET
ncbi:MAG: archaeal heat shock protein Hsp14, partial [Thermoprotei archaeon]